MSHFSEMTNPPLGTVESARDIVQTIALAMKNGYTPNEIFAEHSPIVERVWAEATAQREEKTHAEPAQSSAPMSNETEREALAWVPAHERVPEPGTECVVLLRYSLDRPPFVSIDTWDIQREDPTGMGGPTIETGEGWNDNDENDVIAWIAVPPQPPADWDQRFSDDDRAAHPAEPPRTTLEEAINALTVALVRTKGWTHGYADAVIRDAIDRRGVEPPRTVTGDTEHPLDQEAELRQKLDDAEAVKNFGSAHAPGKVGPSMTLRSRNYAGAVTGDGAGELPEPAKLLVRWGLPQNGFSQGLFQPLPDGYWTPWHIAEAAVAQALKGRGAEPAPVAWIRYRSDGAYEGPILDSAMEEVRKVCGAWTPLYAANPGAAARCPYCDDTGDVHSIDGEWRGVCDCAAGQKWKTRAEPGAAALTDERVKQLWEQSRDEDCGEVSIFAFARAVLAASQP